MREWDIYQTDAVAVWLDELSAEDPKSAELVDDAIYALSCRAVVRSTPGGHDRSVEDQEPEGALPAVQRHE